jgi:hypothetical protein
MRAIGCVDKDEKSLWGIPASLLFHTLLVVALLLSPAAPRLMQAPDAGVAVDLLTPQEFHAAVDPRPAPEAAAPPTSTSQPVPPEDAAPPSSIPEVQPEVPQGMIVARTMLSGKTLADPRSRQAVRELATFADSERVVQLCNLEAMDQVQAWRSDFHPDRLVPYARSDEKMTGDTIVADGAAFRSRMNWYDIRFKCEVAPDHGKVVAFQFQVGKPIPRAEWEGLNLPAVH